MNADSACFHCSEPLAGSSLAARIAERDEPVCCIGCKAVAELIAGAGLEDFYLYRDKPAQRPNEAALAADAWAAYGRPEVAVQFVRRAGEHLESADLLIGGLRCTACSWLIDKVLSRTPGVRTATVNAATGRAYVEWDTGETNLAEVLRTIARLGYQPHPATDANAARLQQSERRTALKRLAVATAGMMQVMMFAVAVYSAEIAGEIMDPGMLSYFRIVSLLVATPVMLYSGQPILLNAWSSMRARAISMDVPVSIALVLAFAASVANALRGTGEVYFDSVTMFIFFLTLGRFAEMSVRHRTAGVTDALARQLPPTAHRVQGHALPLDRRSAQPGARSEGDEIEDVPTAALSVGDIVLVRPGETLPADGVVIEGRSSLDEALLTGESLPVHREVGDTVAAGTLNIRAPLHVRITAIGSTTVLSGIVALLQRAQSRKPAMAQAADAAAATFLRYVLLAAGLTCAGWLIVDPARAFEATLAVLVVSCPCAFSIATPSALAAATARLASQGVLVVRANAIEALARVQHLIFDKTGTLTRGQVRLGKCTRLADMPIAECYSIAAALERASEHPIARAFAAVPATRRAEQVKTVAGSGVEGIVEGRRYRIGTRAYVRQLRKDSVGGSVLNPTPDVGLKSDPPADASIVLGDANSELASFELGDTLREDARAAIAELQGMQIDTEILSGDSLGAVRRIAAECNIGKFLARCSPQEKLEQLRDLQAQGARVGMLGDGINDAPVLGAANVSIAMGAGADLAHASADVILIGERLTALPEAIRTARRTLRIARQNLVWAAAYNMSGLPLAALGYIPPWVAAIGMSASSIAVILNATRLLPNSVIPAKAGTQERNAGSRERGGSSRKYGNTSSPSPAFSSLGSRLPFLGSRFRGNDVVDG